MTEYWKQEKLKEKEEFKKLSKLPMRKLILLALSNIVKYCSDHHNAERSALARVLMKREKKELREGLHYCKGKYSEEIDKNSKLKEEIEELKKIRFDRALAEVRYCKLQDYVKELKDKIACLENEGD